MHLNKATKKITKILPAHYPYLLHKIQLDTSSTTRLVDEILFGLHLDGKDLILNTGHTISNSTITILNLKAVIASGKFDLKQEAAIPLDIVRALLGMEGGE